jgi:NADH-quinone oxidoreductase subunit I
MKKIWAYPYSIIEAFFFLSKGLYRTLHSMLHPKLILTQEYPNNRDTLYIPQRFKATLHLIDDENGDTKCTACGLCQLSCPNGSITVFAGTVQTPEGKAKKTLDSYTYELGNCAFCGLCVDSCNFGALEFTNYFESSEYDRSKLEKILYKSTKV